MSGDMAETSVTDFFTLPKLGRVHQCLDPIMSQKRLGPDLRTGWKLTSMVTTKGSCLHRLHTNHTERLHTDVLFTIACEVVHLSHRLHVRIRIVQFGLFDRMTYVGHTVIHQHFPR